MALNPHYMTFCFRSVNIRYTMGRICNFMRHVIVFLQRYGRVAGLYYFCAYWLFQVSAFTPTRLYCINSSWRKMIQIITSNSTSKHISYREKMECTWRKKKTGGSIKSQNAMQKWGIFLKTTSAYIDQMQRNRETMGGLLCAT